eukprot:1159783-Pelagomonas_calceolata.AAC.2
MEYMHTSVAAHLSGRAGLSPEPHVLLVQMGAGGAVIRWPAGPAARGGSPGPLSEACGPQSPTPAPSMCTCVCTEYCTGLCLLPTHRQHGRHEKWNIKTEHLASAAGTKKWETKNGRQASEWGEVCRALGPNQSMALWLGQHSL